MAVLESLRPVTQNPVGGDHQQERVLFGKEWTLANRGWYSQVGINVRRAPYVVDKTGLLNPDRTPITRNVIRERDALQTYLSTHDVNYSVDVRRAAATFTPMTSDCRIAVQIPAHTEQTGIYNTLSGWAGQADLQGKRLAPSLYEINVINNGPVGYNKDKTLDEIERFRKEHPDIVVNCIDIEIPDKNGNVGMARKFLTDTLVQRSLDRKVQDKPFYIESSDADSKITDPQTLAKRIQELDSKPYLDAVVGEIDFGSDLLMHHDLIFFTNRAREIAKKLLQVKRLRPEDNAHYGFYNAVPTRGMNTAFTAEAYALAGGYLPSPKGEDYDLGRRFRLVRGLDSGDSVTPNTHTVAYSAVKMQTSPRRYIDAAQEGKTMYSSFDAVRTDDTEAIKKVPNARITSENVALFEAVLDRQIGWLTRTVHDPEERKRQIGQLAGFLGFGKFRILDTGEKVNSSETDDKTQGWKPDYIVGDDGKVKIVNIDNLKNTLNAYRQRHAA